MTIVQRVADFILPAFLVALLTLSSASAFATCSTWRMATRHSSAALSRLSQSKEASPSFPALTRDQIETMLADIPIYAVTEVKGDSEGTGVVLLTEANNENSIAYFFLSPETANAVYAPLRAKREAQGNGAVSWDVTKFSLGLVFFELFDTPGQAKNSVEYRLVPRAAEVTAANSMLQQMAQQQGGTPPSIGRLGYNEVPIFIDQRIRVQSVEDGQEKVPLYFGLEDLLQTFRDAQADGSKEQPMVSVAELFSTVQQMQQDDGVTDFSQAVFVALSTPLTKDSASSPQPKKPEAEMPWEKSNRNGPANEVKPLNLSTTNVDAWED